jgi:hypothetical protein
MSEQVDKVDEITQVNNRLEKTGLQFFHVTVTRTETVDYDFIVLAEDRDAASEYVKELTNDELISQCVSDDWQEDKLEIDSIKPMDADDVFTYYPLDPDLNDIPKTSFASQVLEGSESNEEITG